MTKAQVEVKDGIQISIEKFIENSESNLDYTDLYDQIEILMKTPVNINKADFQMLSTIPLITPEKINAIISHRQLYGPFESLYELQQLDVMEMDYIRFMVHFITVNETYSLKTFTDKGFWKGGNHEIILLSAMKIQRSEGYQLPATNPNAYLGSPLRQVLRYKGTVNEHLQLNFITEKDAGEKMNANTMFYSAGLFLKNMDRVRALAIGDYQAAFGQGLTFGSGLAFGKSPFVLNMMRNQNGLRAYHSLNENEFLRGAGITIALNKKFEWTCFYSSKKIDAASNTDTSLRMDSYSSLVNTGYYRSMNEMEKKDVLKRQIIGSHLNFRHRSLELGATMVQTNLSEPIVPANELYQRYNFKGRNLLNTGLDYKWFFKNMIVYGEFSMNQFSENFSFVNGALISLSKNLDISLLQRRYHKSYIGSITNAIGESADNRNENGFYAGFSLVPFKGFKLNAYADLYRSGWLRYLVDAPSGGKETLIELQYSKRKSYSWYIRYRNEVKQQNEEGIQTLNRLENNNRKLWRFHIDHDVSSKFSIRNRVEFVRYKLEFGKSTSGFLIFQDISLSAGRRWKLAGRIMYFDVQDYDSRLYAYESDMLYSYTVPSFQDKGTRFYFLVKYKLKRNIDIWTRFAGTSYENLKEIGSGYDRIKGNRMTEIKLQIKWTL